MINKRIGAIMLSGLFCLFFAVSDSDAGTLGQTGNYSVISQGDFSTAALPETRGPAMKLMAANYLIEEMVEYRWENDNWNEFSKLTNTFNAFDTVASTTWQYWSEYAGDWVNNNRQLNKYNEQGQLIEIAWQAYSGSLWSPFLYTDITYYENGFMKQAHSYYDGPEILELFYYDEYDHLELYLYQTKDDEWSDPVNDHQVFHEFDPDGHRLSYLLQNWVTDHWVNDKKADFVYSEEKGQLRIDEVVYYEWMAGDWQLVDRDRFIYDLDGILNYQMKDNYNGSDWVEYYRITFFYDGLGLVEQELHEEYDSMDGWENYSKRNRKYKQFTTDVIQVDEKLPADFSVSQNHPNPFNLSTMIDFSLDTRSDVRLEIFNLLGQKVRTLVDREMTAGNYTVDWDGYNEQGRVAATGLYFYRFKANNQVQVRKMMLLK